MRERWLAGAVVVPFVLGALSAPVDAGREVFTFRDPEIVESSGLVVVDGLAVTTNDSGDTGRVFAVDPGTGRTVGVTRWSEDPTDVEALAPAGDGAVWVGDLGDNTGSRDSVAVARVPVGRGDRTVDPESYDLVYPDGPVDAESLLADPTTGRLYVASKSVFGGKLYAAPRTLAADGPNRLRRLGRVLPIATDSAFFPDGEHLVVRDYARAVVYTFPDLAEIGSFRLPDQEQGEGLAVAADGSLLISSEGQFAPVLRVPLPGDVRRAMASTAASPSGSGASSGAPTAAPSGTPPAAGPRVGRELPETSTASRPQWPWFLTAWIALGGLVIAARAMRQR